MAEGLTLTEEQLVRLEAAEIKILSLARLMLRYQNKDDFGVATRYLTHLLAQVCEDLNRIKPYIEANEATLNLLETRM